MSQKDSLNIGIVCGEHSGDRLGADLINEIKKNTSVNLYGVGGPKLEALGIKSEFNKKKIIYFNNIQSACKNSDLIIIHTEWNEFKQLNFKKLNNKKKFNIFVIRNLYSPVKLKSINIDFYSI